MIIDDKTGEGTAGIIVYLGGMVTVTNIHGEFVFNSVKPGIHYINIERGELKKNYIPTKNLPLELKVEQGKETEYKRRTL